MDAVGELVDERLLDEPVGPHAKEVGRAQPQLDLLALVDVEAKEADLRVCRGCEATVRGCAGDVRLQYGAQYEER